MVQHSCNDAFLPADLFTHPFVPILISSAAATSGLILSLTCGLCKNESFEVVVVVVVMERAHQTCCSSFRLGHDC
jgi:hypothetical protein